MLIAPVSPVSRVAFVIIRRYLWGWWLEFMSVFWQFCLALYYVEFVDIFVTKRRHKTKDINLLPINMRQSTWMRSISIVSISDRIKYINFRNDIIHIRLTITSKEHRKNKFIYVACPSQRRRRRQSRRRGEF